MHWKQQDCIEPQDLADIEHEILVSAVVNLNYRKDHAQRVAYANRHIGHSLKTRTQARRAEQVFKLLFSPDTNPGE